MTTPSQRGYPVYDVENPEGRHSTPWRARRADLEQIVGRRLPKELFEYVPWGRRMLVVRESPETTYGRIHIPRIAQDSNAKSYGWVVTAGELVGAPDSRLPLGFSVYGPEEILLRKLAFGRYSGVSYSVLEDPEEVAVREQYLDVLQGRGAPIQPYVILTDGDILGEIIPTNKEDVR